MQGASGFNNCNGELDGGKSIKAAKIHADGAKENSILVASSSDKRSSGFPPND